MAAWLVSPEEVKALLNIDTTDFDAVKLPLLIGAASAAVIRYLKANAADVIGLDDDGELLSGTIVPDDIVMATVWFVGWLMLHPDDDPGKYFEQGYLPKVVTSLLYPYRDPAMA